jgi:hypothetical protein
MSLKPDYCLRQMNNGISQDVNLNFYDFWLFSLSVLGEGQYSTMVEVPLAGELHALSLDFNQNQLEQILSKASPHIRYFPGLVLTIAQRGRVQTGPFCVH